MSRLTGRKLVQNYDSCFTSFKGKSWFKCDTTVQTEEALKTIKYGLVLHIKSQFLWE